MTKRLFISGLMLAALLAGCGNDNSVAPALDDAMLDGSVFQRPEFIDTRPVDVQRQFTLTADDVAQLPPVLDKAGKYALVIGISDYEGTVNDLTYCDEDADDWIARLVTEGYQVTSLIDMAATRAAIETAVANLAAQSVAGNEIAFAYSGHGSKGNMISADLTYVSKEWFGGMFAGVASTKMMFTFDACQIGEFTLTLAGPGRVVTVASDRRRYSYDGDATMANGVFTYYQMLGFDQQGFIFVEDDSDYAIEQFFIWAAAHRVKVAPSYTDTYVGDMDL